MPARPSPPPYDEHRLADIKLAGADPTMGIMGSVLDRRECILSWVEVSTCRPACTVQRTVRHFVRGGMRQVIYFSKYSETHPPAMMRYPARDQLNWPPLVAWLSVARTCAPSAVTSNRPMEDRTARLCPSGDQTSADRPALCATIFAPLAAS